jgi:hypothetical protein
VAIGLTNAAKDCNNGIERVLPVIVVLGVAMPEVAAVAMLGSCTIGVGQGIYNKMTK